MKAQHAFSLLLGFHIWLIMHPELAKIASLENASVTKHCRIVPDVLGMQSL